MKVDSYKRKLNAAYINILIIVFSLNKKRLWIKLSHQAGISVSRLNAEHSGLRCKVLTFHYDS